MFPGDRVGAAVSGGADSVALLRLLLEARAELGIVLSVVHFNHKIRGAEADADELFVRELARGLQLEFHCDSFDTPAHARFRDLSLEAAARELRYQFFWKLVRDGTIDRTATAHTRDDQAETVLLRFLRGAGTRGLSGIYPSLREGMYSRSQIERRELPIGDSPWIVRPLLDVTREDLRAYLCETGQPWREDASNQDLSFTRNRVRHELLPLLAREYNPAVAEVLSKAAEIARAEEEYWQEVVRCCLPKLLSETPVDNRRPSLQCDILQAQPLALQRRLVRAIAEQQGLRLEFHHVEEVLSLSRCRASTLPRIELPHGWEAVRQQRELWLQPRCQTMQEPPAYDLALPVPREIEAAGRKIRAALVMASDSDLAGQRSARPSGTRQEPGAGVSAVLLDVALAQGHLRVRNWRAGDRYWPEHTSAPKKLKELLQARHIARYWKPVWPVVVCGEEIVWVPGFPAPERFRVRDGASEALLLEEVPLGQSD